MARSRRRRFLKLALSAAILAGTLALALHLSYPRDNRGTVRVIGSRQEYHVEQDGEVLRVRDAGGTRRYRFYRDEEGLYARELGRNER